MTPPPELIKLRIGTRGSRLALAQTTHVAETLREQFPEIDIEVVIIQTTGDKILDSSLSKIGGKGVFTKEIEDALLDGRIDVAVHSLKDLPTIQPKGLCLGAISKRESPFDVLIAREPLEISALGAEHLVGTSSLRRRAQLLRLNPNIVINDLRGNVPTRVQRMIDGQYTAIILAEAGMNRLSQSAPYIQRFSAEQMLPAPAQGALGLQCREGDDATLAVLATFHDEPTAACCNAERALLQGLGGGCQLPLGTLAEITTDGKLKLRGCVVSLAGVRCIQDMVEGDCNDPVALGRALAERLLAKGADEILHELGVDSSNTGFDDAVARSNALDRRPLGGRKVIVTRDEDADGPLSTAIRDAGGHPVCLPLIKHAPPENPAPLAEAVARIDEYDWVVFTSARGVESLARPLKGLRPRIACVGKATARAVEKAGGTVDFVSPHSMAAGLIGAFQTMTDIAGKRVFYPRVDIASEHFKEALEAMGVEVDDVIAYRTVQTGALDSVVNALRYDKPLAITFCSASSVEPIAKLIANNNRTMFDDVIIASIGPSTSTALCEVNLAPHVEASERSFNGLVDALVEHVKTSPSP